MSHELISSISFDSLITKRQAVIERVEQILKLESEVCQILNSLDAPGFLSVLHGTSKHTSLFNVPNHKQMATAQQRMDKLLWRNLMEKSGLRQYMSTKMLEEWDAILYDERKPVPELTLEAVRATFEGLSNNRYEMMIDAVVELFKSMSWSYANNLPHKLGKKLILTHMNTYSRSVNRLNDLERVVNMIQNGKPYDDRLGEIYYKASMKNNSGSHDHGWCTLRWFKNDNCHVLFSDKALVDELNKLIATRFPAALPPVK
jgi:hypothetical protein